MGQIEFNSREEAFKFLEESRRLNDKVAEVLSPEQRSVTWGSCWIRFWEDLAIFGRVSTIEAVIAEESGDVPELTGDPERDAERQEAIDEAAQIVSLVVQSEQDGYVYGWCHSKIESGEIGSTHRGNLWPIDEALFAHAKQHDWDPDKFRPIFRLEVVNAYKHYQEWARSLSEELLDAGDAVRKAAEDHSGGDPHESR